MLSNPKKISKGIILIELIFSWRNGRVMGGGGGGEAGKVLDRSFCQEVQLVPLISILFKKVT